MIAIDKTKLIFPWTIVLIASPLAIIFWRTLAAHEPFWWPWIHFAALLFFLSLTFFKSALKPFSRFTAIVVVIFIMGYGGGWDWGLIPFIRLGNHVAPFEVISRVDNIVFSYSIW
jgi:hypothetical protein